MPVDTYLALLTCYENQKCLGKIASGHEIGLHQHMGEGENGWVT